MEGYIFEKFFYHLKIWGWSSSLRTIDDLPRAHRDETEFMIFTVSCVFQYFRYPRQWEGREEKKGRVQQQRVSTSCRTTVHLESTFFIPGE